MNAFSYTRRGFVMGALMGTGYFAARSQTDVTDLESRITALETRVALVPEDVPIPGSFVEETDEQIVVTGTGTQVSDPFFLDEGGYILVVSVVGNDGASTYLDLKVAPGSESIATNTILAQGSDTAPYGAEKLCEVLESGEFVITSSGDADFTVTIEL